MHHFLWNFVHELVGLMEEANSRDVTQSCKTPAGEEERNQKNGDTKKTLSSEEADRSSEEPANLMTWDKVQL